MTNRQKIKDICSQYELKIVTMNYDRTSIPTPDQFAPGGEWNVVIGHKEGQSQYVGTAEEIIEEIKANFIEVT